MKNIIYIVLGMIGFILAIGTIGATDLEKITFNQLVIRSLIAIILIGISFFGLNLEEKREANRRHKHGTRKNF